MSDNQISYSVALSIVIAGMIGAGVFSTLGVQAEMVPDVAGLLILWILGGFIALCGAVCYAELAAALPRSGGEYHYLTYIYPGHLGELSGWVSVTLGFAAPIALAAIAAGYYATIFLKTNPTLMALAIIIFIGATHASDVKLGNHFQFMLTTIKVLMILAFCISGLIFVGGINTQLLMPTIHTIDTVFSGPFAISLIYVSYAYSGWNSAVYVAGEVTHPECNVPRAMMTGTLVVTLLYVFINLTFLQTIELQELKGKVAVGALSAGNIFGESGEFLISGLLFFVLISSISALQITGSRVLSTMGEDIRALSYFATRNRQAAPARSIVFQQILASLLVLTQSFETVLVFSGFLLSLFSLVTVLGIIKLRQTEPQLARPFRVPFYPFTPLLFIVFNGISIFFVIKERPLTALSSIVVLIVGWSLIKGLHKKSK